MPFGFNFKNMDKKRRILEDYKSGALYRFAKHLEKLKTPFYLIVNALAFEYEVKREIVEFLLKRTIRANEPTPQEEQEHRQKRQKKRHTEDRNDRIRFRFYDLYEKDRIRLDDTIQTISKEFCVSERVVTEVIRGAIASGEMNISGADTVQHFNIKTHRKRREERVKEIIISKLKQDYEQNRTKK